MLRQLLTQQKGRNPGVQQDSDPASAGQVWVCPRTGSAPAGLYRSPHPAWCQHPTPQPLAQNRVLSTLRTVLTTTHGP